MQKASSLSLRRLHRSSAGLAQLRASPAHPSGCVSAQAAAGAVWQEDAVFTAEATGESTFLRKIFPYDHKAQQATPFPFLERCKGGVERKSETGGC